MRPTNGTARPRPPWAAPGTPVRRTVARRRHRSVRVARRPFAAIVVGPPASVRGALFVRSVWPSVVRIGPRFPFFVSPVLGQTHNDYYYYAYPRVRRARRWIDHDRRSREQRGFVSVKTCDAKNNRRRRVRVEEIKTQTVYTACAIRSSTYSNSSSSKRSTLPT